MPDPGRRTALVQPRVLTISSRHDAVPMKFAQPGTVALLVANADGAELLQQIGDAVEREDLAEVERLYTTTKEQFAATMLTADRETLAREHDRTHATFVHGRRRVVLGMFTPTGAPVAHSLALLDSEDVDASSFAVAVSQAEGVDDEVFALAVARQAELTPLEREVLGRIPDEVGRGPGAVELGYWTEGIVARFAIDLGERAIEYAANELGVTDQIRAVQDIVGQVEHAAEDVVGAAVDAADGIIHGLAEAAGIDGIIQAGEDVVNAVGDVVNAVDNAVNNAVDAAADVVADAAGAVVDAAADAVGQVADAVGQAAEAVGNAVDAAADAVGDAVGAAVDWVAANIFGGTDEEFQAQFLEAAAAQQTFQRVFQRQVDSGIARLETVQPAASLDQLIAARSQLVARAAAPRTRAISLITRGFR